MVIQWTLINSQPVVIFPNDKLMIGSITFPIEQGDDFLIEGNVSVNIGVR